MHGSITMHGSLNPTAITMEQPGLEHRRPERTVAQQGQQLAAGARWGTACCSCKVLVTEFWLCGCYQCCTCGCKVLHLDVRGLCFGCVVVVSLVGECAAERAAARFWDVLESLVALGMCLKGRGGLR